jgi:phytoene dehydrogenase-like protein
VTRDHDIDVVVVGSGPNGLAAAVTAARAGLQVLVLERDTTIGGGARSAELTEAGVIHDVCSAVHPMAFASPFFRAFDLAARVQFAVPPASYGHPLDNRDALIAYRNFEQTIDEFGHGGAGWRRLLAPLVSRIEGVIDFTSSHLLRWPTDPVAAVAFGSRALVHGSAFGLRALGSADGRALLAGVAAHANSRLPGVVAAGVGLTLAAHGHVGGWPIPIGGTQRIVDALVDDLVAHGGTLETGVEITRLEEIAPSRAAILDVTPRALARMLGDRAPRRYGAALRRFGYGPGVFKLDLLLSGPIPWHDPRLVEAGTVHLGGTADEIRAAEAEVAAGRHPERPYVLLSQPSLFDPTRAPAGRHVIWAYTHVPAGSDRDVASTVLGQLERFAPGVRDLVVASHAERATDLERRNPNYVGGDINAGALDLRQLFKRPVLSRDPWRTRVPGVYLASSSTPPGTGVHGLAGWHAARSALRHEFGITASPDLAPGS